MSETDVFLQARSESIPEIFWSDLEARPFSNCILCKSEFLVTKEPYLIEKAVQGFNGKAITNTIFEYAVCLSCADQMQVKLSVSSRERIAHYFQSQVDFIERAKRLKEEPLEDWLENCLIHQESVNRDGECQIYALCQGDQLLVQEFPYMIRAEALDEIMELISAETLEQLDDFKNDLFDGPPELKELFEKGGPKVLI
ncbi:MAG: hypothetical protein RIC95_10415 [Vicingaceae bacterium]